jgi:hypothetical protein
MRLGGLTRSRLTLVGHLYSPLAPRWSKRPESDSHHSLKADGRSGVTRPSGLEDQSEAASQFGRGQCAVMSAVQRRPIESGLFTYLKLGSLVVGHYCFHQG